MLLLLWEDSEVGWDVRELFLLLALFELFDSLLCAILCDLIIFCGNFLYLTHILVVPFLWNHHRCIRNDFLFLLFYTNTGLSAKKFILAHGLFMLNYNLNDSQMFFRLDFHQIVLFCYENLRLWSSYQLWEFYIELT